MSKVLQFGDVLEAADELALEDQEELVAILHRRIIERRREKLAAEIQAAYQEFVEGKCRPVTPDELMAEVLA